jgi:hypothetical protein
MYRASGTCFRLQCLPVAWTKDLIELSAHLGVLNYYYIYPNELSLRLRSLQELNGVSRAETEPPKGTLVPRLRPPVAEIMTVECWSDYCCYTDACTCDTPEVP